MPNAHDLLRIIEPMVFGHRAASLLILCLLTAFFAWHAAQIQLDAGFEKQLPGSHPWMQTLKQHRGDFGGANLISIALMNRKGDIYNEEFLGRLKELTNAVFFLPGVDRSRVQSLFTPGVRYVEIVEGGISSGDVIPRNYAPTPQMFAQIRTHVAKAGIIGRLVAENQQGAMVVAELLEYHPVSGEKLDYREVEKALEDIRLRFESDTHAVHIIGFAMVVGSIAKAANEVIVFFAIALLLTALLLRVYCASWRLSFLPLGCSLIAIIWEFGLLRIAGFGLDPFAILVPFLVLANGVEHGIQMVNAWADEVTSAEVSPKDAAILSFRRVAIPGTAALMTDVLGFATIALIDIQIIREMAINAALGMLAIIVTNKWLMPILLTKVQIPNRAEYRRKLEWREAVGAHFWRLLAMVTRKNVAPVVIAAAAGLFGFALWKAQGLQIGDLKQGVPELRSESRYNQDSQTIVNNFAIGVDVLKIFLDAGPQACIRHEILAVQDRLVWHLQNTPGVNSVLSLAQASKALRMGWNEGSPNWNALARNKFALAQTVSNVPTSSGLQNPDCSVLPLLVFTEDHKSQTINNIVQQVRNFQREINNSDYSIQLAGGNVGVMAATNEVIAAEEKPILIWVYLAVGLMCWLSFRSVGAMFCVMWPLAIVSFLAYALMTYAGIGLKVATLPVTALAVGIGIDFGIYSYAVLLDHLKAGLDLESAWLKTLQQTGKAVIFTGIALSLGVITWVFSDLQFQRDMGFLLTFMFLSNMIGAIILLPALARYFVKHRIN